MMSRDYLFRNKFQPPKKFGVKMGVKKSLEFFFWQKEEGIVSRRPLFFLFSADFLCFYGIPNTTLEKKNVELVSRAREYSSQTSEPKERQKERKKEEESIHSSVLRGRSPRSPPTVAVKKNMMGKRETFFN